MRTKFICVSPITPKARIFFELDMLELHSCRVEREDPDKYHLESITKRRFSISKHNDSDWRIEQ
jgi:hypothetical protein